MRTPRKTVWDIEPHTRAKHEILRRYLQAWMPILAQGGFREVMYIDGFAGPGRYSRGEEGSPVIALDVALDQPALRRAEVRFVFVEKDPARAGMLRTIVDAVELPDNFQVEVIGGHSFQTAMDGILSTYRTQGRPAPPTFAFIDPFGWTGAPFSVVHEIMGNRNCEVLVTFMYEEINRFLAHPDQTDNFDVFFGTSDWREGLQLPDPHRRNRFLHDLYLRQLRESACAKYVRSFEMRNRKDVVDYYLFHATNSLLGLKRMKEAMWKVDEAGEFRFSDATNPDQLVLFETAPRYDVLQAELLAHFGGREASVKEIEEFILAETAFRETHYKRQVLRPLELANPPMLEVVDPPASRTAGTYAQASLKLRFLPVRPR